MDLNIDSFLENNINSEEVLSDDKKIEKKIDLSFQKSVEDNLVDLKEDKNLEEYDFLKKAYVEVKKFDEDLPNKFLGIENKGGEILAELGDKYSDGFLKNVKDHVFAIETKIEKTMLLIKKYISTNHFVEAINEIEKSRKHLNFIPEHFLSMKYKLFLKLNHLELELNNQLMNFKENNLVNIKNKIQIGINKLNQSLVPGDLDIIKENYEEVFHLYQGIPTIYYSELVSYRSILLKTLSNAQNYLFSENKREFMIKKENIENLTEKFLKLKLEKRLEDLLVVYDEIILEFKKMPEVFFEEKIKVFKDINKLFGSINSIIVKDNFKRFYETYNSGKSLEEIREYLEHINKTKKINKTNLVEIKYKLDQIPNKYAFEKKELLAKLNDLILIFDGKYKNYSNKLKIEEKKEDDIKEADIIKFFNFPKISPNIKKEMDFYFNKLKESSNPNELKIFYSKLIFYLNFLNLNEVKKRNFILKLNKIMESKKLKWKL